MQGARCRVRVPSAECGVPGVMNGPGSRRHRGFTMVELLVVISIIVILASMGMAQYRNSVVRAREAVLKEDLFRMRDAIDQYYADKTKYPASLEDLVSDGYLREIPVDPFTNSKETWQAVNAETNVNDTTAQPGIYDVKSGSEETSLDGTRYADWD
jgi:general secretion pathway protein G